MKRLSLVLLATTFALGSNAFANETVCRNADLTTIPRDAQIQFLKEVKFDSGAELIAPVADNGHITCSVIRKSGSKSNMPIIKGLVAKRGGVTPISMSTPSGYIHAVDIELLHVKGKEFKSLQAVTCSLKNKVPSSHNPINAGQVVDALKDVLSFDVTLSDCAPASGDGAEAGEKLE